MKLLLAMVLMTATAVAAAQVRAVDGHELMCVSAGSAKELCIGAVLKRKAGDTTLIFEEVSRAREIRGAGEASLKTADMSRPVGSVERRKTAYVTGEDWCKDNKR